MALLSFDPRMIDPAVIRYSCGKWISFPMPVVLFIVDLSTPRGVACHLLPLVLVA
jgi:hypothetical protein